MMSTADSALLSFSSMWVKDLFVPYLRPRATERQQLWFGRMMSVIGLAIGVALGKLLSTLDYQPQLLIGGMFHQACLYCIEYSGFILVLLEMCFRNCTAIVM